MKLDATELRYVLPDEFRVLQAVSVYEQIIASTSTNLGESEQVETGSKNHEVVPTQLIAQLSKITGGNVNKCLGSLAKRGLVSRVQGAKCRFVVAERNLLNPYLNNYACLLLQMMATGSHTEVSIGWPSKHSPKEEP
jgi:hypothetical protein